MAKSYEEALNEMVTKELRDLGKPQDWGVNSYEEVVQKEIKSAGGAREYAKSGTFPYEYSEIEAFMKEHGQEPKADKYFDDLAETLENFRDPEVKKVPEKAVEPAKAQTSPEKSTGKTFTEEERQAYAEKKRQQMNNLGTLKDNMLEEVFKDNDSFKEYIDDNATIIGRMGVTNQFSVAVDSPGVREIGTRSKWNRLGFYPKNEDAKGHVVVPKKYADENGEIRQGFQVEPYFTPESFKAVEIKKRDENGKVTSVETKDLSRVAAVKYHETQNDFQTARDSRYKAYVMGLNDAKLNTNVEMNPEEAFKSNAIKYVAMRDLRVSKAEFELGEVGDKFDVAKVKPEARESFLKDIHKGAQKIINTAEKQLKDAPHYTQDMFKTQNQDKQKER